MTNSKIKVEVVRLAPKRVIKGDPKAARCASRWGIKVNGEICVTNITNRQKAERRARGLESRPYLEGGKSGPIMDLTGRCLSRKERGMPPVKEKK